MKRHRRSQMPLVVTWIALVASSANSREVEKPDTADSRATRIAVKIADEAKLDIKALWKPISESHFNSPHDWPELRDFRPAKQVHRYGARDFRSFLPRDGVAAGEAWKIDAERALEFLRQFHARATTELHINNGDSHGGGYATLARYDDRFAEIVFRFHGEFIFDTGWLTPGRFMGKLGIDRTTGGVAWFRMYVPPNRVNCDAGWRRGKEEIEVEVDGKKRKGTIEYPTRTVDCNIEQMELVGGDATVIKDVKWTESKTEAELEKILADKFYAFSKIELVPFEDALAAARKSGKLLHLIVLSGWLDDESCWGSGKIVRAGPLSDADTIARLNKRFVNVWILEKEVRSIQPKVAAGDSRRLADAVIPVLKKGSPVDSLIFTPDLRFLAIQSANDVVADTVAMRIESYQKLLDDALAKISSTP